eukprot:362725-Chlamydomonas_euryale.AAC.2
MSPFQPAFTISRPHSSCRPSNRPSPVHGLTLFALCSHDQMLSCALGVAGPDGAFRGAAEAALCALRARRDGAAALFDAVLADPGVEWAAEREDAAAHGELELAVALQLFASRVEESRERVSGGWRCGKCGVRCVRILGTGLGFQPKPGITQTWCNHFSSVTPRLSPVGVIRDLADLAYPGSQGGGTAQLRGSLAGERPGIDSATDSDCAPAGRVWLAWWGVAASGTAPACAGTAGAGTACAGTA